MNEYEEENSKRKNEEENDEEKRKERKRRIRRLKKNPQKSKAKCVRVRAVCTAILTKSFQLTDQDSFWRFSQVFL